MSEASSLPMIEVKMSFQVALWKSGVEPIMRPTETSKLF
jgi:hypothetical protein